MSNRPVGSNERFGLDDTLGAVHERRRVASVHDHHDEEGSNDHLASIYESQREQFETVVPFVQHGLEQGERCLYVADDNTRAEIVRALRTGGVDVETALETGALSIHTKADTYLRTGAFDQEAMLEFWEETLSKARDEDGYAGVRAAAEMTWALDEGADLDRVVQYEAALNTIYPGEEYVVLCQYNRERFPEDVISDVIRSHPLVVSDGTVCRNVYYHPPNEFFGTDHPQLDVERTVEGLVSRARTEAALGDSERQLRVRLHQQEVATALGQRALNAHDLDSLLADVTERVADTLNADYCNVLELLPDGEELRLRDGVGWQDGLVGEATVGTDLDSQAGYTLLSNTPVLVEDLSTESRFSGPDLLTDHDVTSGISVVIGTTDDPWGVLGVHTRDRREFSEHDAGFIQNVANTVATAVERAEREHDERALHDITSNPDRSFEAKLQALFELGCERFDLELGGLARVDPTTDSFEVEAVSGERGKFVSGVQAPLSETYCRMTVDDGTTVGVTDPERAGLDGSLAHEEFDVETYLGSLIELENTPDRTFFFVSSTPRDRPFSDDERAFHRLMTQWVEYELERKHHERSLSESNERLEQFAYAASHDLQEPLRMVSSYLQLLERRYGDDLDETGEEFLEFAVDGADRMRKMIDGLLEYSRVETQGDPFEPIDLEDVLDDALENLHLQIEESEAEITVEALPRVEGDGYQLRQVFQNILENAITYSGDDPPRIHVGATRRGREWVLSIRDEGIGIDRDDHDRVFTVFDRLHSRDEFDGTGIGLALCQRIVERHGGDIWVDSEPGRGATFSFTLSATDT